ncbi:glycosyltransferase [Candidatus Gracilibacteria bacterium]|nr:glycosyltransferase [Candidatus Gracilibacteria bacterium]MCF7819595.1 glycosyltransferase [Candidatus Gracilibacteria bacterium]
MKLSIIIPTIGRPTLEKVLDGIEQCEKYEEIRPEVIVVFNTGSQDSNSGTLKFQSEVETDQCKIFRSSKRGAAAARNLGIDRSTGEIIIFLGDDTIPTREWLRQVYDFHAHHRAQKEVLLGKVSWIQELASDPFHQWLENHGQFDFETIAKKGPTWWHFYTSNISLKRSFIISERFSEEFSGWGFEDTEFGYRLAQKGMQMHYDPECEVLHDHRQTLEGFLEATKNARKNAAVFERLHPEIKILPRGLKLLALKMTIILAQLLPDSPQRKWWINWKKAWTEKE